MATGISGSPQPLSQSQSPSPSQSQSQSQSLTQSQSQSQSLSHSLSCAVCLEVYSEPRFLQCHHTFCSRCILTLAQRHGGTSLPCPVCRKVTTLPPGGVASLQTNFFISTEQLEEAREGRTCLTHCEPLRLFCLHCDQRVCVTCLVDEHEEHKVVGVKTAAGHVRQVKLPAHRARLAAAEGQLTRLVQASGQEVEAVKEKRAAVESNIRQRHAVVLAAADKFRDAALASLAGVQADLEGSLDAVHTQRQASLIRLHGFQRQVDTALQGGSDLDVLLTAGTMTHGPARPQALTALTSLPAVSLAATRPVLRFGVTADAMLLDVRDFLGTARALSLDGGQAEMRVVVQFPCGGADTDVEVFSLCHVDGQPPEVLVAFERRGLQHSVPVESFSETGESQGCAEDRGKVSNTRYAEGLSMSTQPVEGSVFTFSKSPRDAPFQLNNDLSGTACVFRVTVTDKAHIVIDVGAHRAFDVDAGERFFVVVEEAQPPDMWRKVRLYQRLKQSAVSTYSPPTPTFQPSDVCFFSLQGEECLLIADELTDSLHVVHVQPDGTMKFARSLRVACCAVTQPTAVNVDVLGRLWLACRGNIVCLKPTA